MGVLPMALLMSSRAPCIMRGQYTPPQVCRLGPPQACRVGPAPGLSRGSRTHADGGRPGRPSAPSRRNRGKHPAAFLSIAPEGVKSLGLMLRAAEHVVDLPTHESVAQKLNVHSGTEIDACLFPWTSDHHLPVGCPRDSVADIAPHFEAAGP